jgi:hypothetical protein
MLEQTARLSCATTNAGLAPTTARDLLVAVSGKPDLDRAHLLGHGSSHDLDASDSAVDDCCRTRAPTRAILPRLT